MLRIRLRVGHAITLSGTILGLVLLYFTVYVMPLVRVIFTLAAFFALWYFPHTLCHFIVGRLLGVNFSYYFVGRTGLRRLIKSVGKIPIPVLGIKIDRNSFDKVARWRKRTMFLSGVFASMFLPVLCLAVSLSYPYNVVMLLIVFGNIAFTLPASYLAGDVWKARRV
jgi:hypothetical protein